MFNRSIRIAVASAIALLAYLLVYRPRQLRWGATGSEVARSMPGDEIQPRPIFNATRAITIHARSEQIWPWLMQIGYKRAGWYGYDLIDNAGIPSADRILSEWQHLRVGDPVPIWKGINFKVAAIAAGRYVVWESASGRDSMALALYPLDPGHTRLVWRIHNAPYSWTSPFILIQLFTDLSDFLAVRQNLQGIKARAEGVTPEAPAVAYLELTLWLASFAGFLTAEVVLVVRHDWLLPLIAAAATVLITTGLVLSRPAVWVDALTVTAVYVGLWGMHRVSASNQAH